MSGWSWQDVILYWLPYAGIAIVVGLDRWHYRRTCRRYEERWGVPYDGP